MTDKLREAAHQPWCASRTQMLLSNPPQPAPCDCQPKAELAIKPDLTTEPVAWMVTDSDGRHFIFRMDKPVVRDGETLTPLYTAPQPRKRLTSEEIEAILYEGNRLNMVAFARAIEAAVWGDGK